MREASTKQYRVGIRQKEKARIARALLIAGRQAAYFLSFAALRSSSALSVFSHENAVAFCFLPFSSV